MCKFTVQKLNAGNGDVIDEHVDNRELETFDEA